MTDKLTAVIDYDVIAYRASAAGETRSIKAYHPITRMDGKLGHPFKCL